MAERYIEVEAGDRVIIYAVPAEDTSPPPEPPDQTADDLMVLTEIGGVSIYANPDGTYVHMVSNLDVCNDGSGPAHGDQYHQSMTAYCSGGKTGSKYMNADVDFYVVVPPQIRSMVDPIVMGCAARVTNMQTGKVFDAVVGDIGPENKTGECAYCLAKKLNPHIGHNSGDDTRNYFYEIFPGRVATVNGFTYKLQPA